MVLDFVPTKFWNIPAGLSRESWISSTSRWHLGSDLISDGAVAGTSPGKGTSRLDVICSYVLYFCNSGVLLLPQPWHSMYSSRLKSFLKKHFYFHTSAFFWNIWKIFTLDSICCLEPAMTNMYFLIEHTAYKNERNCMVHETRNAHGKNIFPLWFEIVRLQRRDKVGSWIKNIFRSHWEANRKSFKGQLHQFIYAPSLRENLLDFQVELRRRGVERELGQAKQMNRQTNEWVHTVFDFVLEKTILKSQIY